MKILAAILTLAGIIGFSATASAGSGPRHGVRAAHVLGHVALRGARHAHRHAHRHARRHAHWRGHRRCWRHRHWVGGVLHRHCSIRHYHYR